jgi:hypothetical protein
MNDEKEDEEEEEEEKEWKGLIAPARLTGRTSKKKNRHTHSLFSYCICLHNG